MIEIKNEYLTVEVNELGAELTSTYENNSEIEYIWNGDAWPKHAPILFPAIGRSDNDSYLIDDQEYHMDQHGFVASQVFDVIDIKDNEVSLKLSENKETLSSYPFKFELVINYLLEGKKLITNFRVNNTNQNKLSFSLGFHPAFNIPISKGEKFEDYHLKFLPKQSKLQKFEIVKSPFPYRSGNVVDIDEKDNFPLSRRLFDDGLIIFKNDIEEVDLYSEIHHIRVNMSDFSNLCIWTKEDIELPFLCIEPFYGLPDIVNKKQELLNKEGNYILDTNESKEFSCSIEFD